MLRMVKEIDMTRAYVNRVVNNTFVKLMEALGFDIEPHYVKREESNE